MAMRANEYCPDARPMLLSVSPSSFSFHWTSGLVSLPVHNLRLRLAYLLWQDNVCDRAENETSMSTRGSLILESGSDPPPHTSVPYGPDYMAPGLVCNTDSLAQVSGSAVPKVQPGERSHLPEQGTRPPHAISSHMTVM